jgi:hypothetical protein
LQALARLLAKSLDLTRHNGGDGVLLHLADNIVRMQTFVQTLVNVVRVRGWDTFNVRGHGEFDLYYEHRHCDEQQNANENQRKQPENSADLVGVFFRHSGCLRRS